MGRSPLRRCLALALVIGLTMSAADPGTAEPEPVGVVAFVENIAFSMRPGRSRARVYRLDGVTRNATFETEPDAHLELRFLDGSEIKIGPASTLVIDEFVFDPSTALGSSVVSLLKGVMRFVSGRIPNAGVRLVTPTSTIGVRGSEGVITVARVRELRGDARRLARRSLDTLLDATSMDRWVTLLAVRRGAFTIRSRSGGLRTVHSGSAIAVLSYHLGRIVPLDAPALEPDTETARIPAPRRPREDSWSGVMPNGADPSRPHHIAPRESPARDATDGQCVGIGAHAPAQGATAYQRTCERPTAP